MAHLIPASLNKVVLINNNLNDESVAALFNSLANLLNGPKVLAIDQNSLDFRTLEPICNFLQSDAATGLKQFIIKDPVSNSLNKRQNIECITNHLSTHGHLMFRLKELVLQRIGMTKIDIMNLCKFLRSVGSLKVLNLAANGLTAHDLIPMFETL